MIRLNAAAIAILLYQGSGTVGAAAFTPTSLHRRSTHTAAQINRRGNNKPYRSSSRSALSMSWVDNLKIPEIPTSTTPLPLPTPPAVEVVSVVGTDDASIVTFFTAVMNKALSQLPSNDLERIIDTVISTVQTKLSSLDSTITNDIMSTNPLLNLIYIPLKETLLSLLSTSSSSSESLSLLIDKLNEVPPLVALISSAVVTYVAASSVLNLGKTPAPSVPYPNGVYDANSARLYFSERPGMVIARAVEVTILSLGFGLNLLRDYLSNTLSQNAEDRAVELSQLLTKLGPSFIKIGQSLSIRTDLLSPAYVRGLKTLQDRVPPFSTPQARTILEEELGRNVDDLFSQISNEPVAAASLGQVYRATLREGEKEVAIKVQRPDITNQIALDMHLIRSVAPFLKRTFNLNTDLVGVVDTWGVGFVNELDYVEEGRNGMQFTESIQSTPLSTVVFAPPVLSELTTGKVLITEWIEGERLDRSAQRDVTVLCGVAMNTYLTMMLETGVLHCDPHPGNLLRTPDGRLCVLDWGMVTELDPDLRVTLIEHMAHLTSADYAEIPKDLLRLGFIPPDKADLIEDSGVVETLAEVYGAWTAGGGAAKINVNKVISQLQDLTVEKGNLFQIPPYFAYIAKSFSVLEGIGLSNDENYSIINECLPYVSKRLLTDNSERTGGALSTFIFGPDKNDKERLIDYDRVEQLITGFGDYSTSTSGELLGKETVARVQVFERAADQILDLLLTEEETPLQTIFLEQLAKIMSSTSKSVWSRVREQSGTLPSGRTVLGTLVDPLGFWRSSPIVRMDELDEKTIVTTRNLIDLLSRQVRERNAAAAAESGNDGTEAPAMALFDVSTLSNEEVVDLSSILVRKLWERRFGFFETGKRLGKVLIELTADKLESGGEKRLGYGVTATPPVREATKTSGANADGDGAVSSGVTERRAAPLRVSSETSVRSSRRLDGAKRLLEQLQKEDSASSQVEAMPVTNTSG